jgi:hypothetical protein
MGARSIAPACVLRDHGLQKIIAATTRNALRRDVMT